MGELLHDLPCLILFHSNFDFSQACAYCEDFELYVLELFIDSFACLAFYVLEEFEVCVDFCNLLGLDIMEYMQFREI